MRRVVLESVVRNFMFGKWKVSVYWCVCLVCSLLLCFSVCSVYRHQFPSSFIFTPSILDGVSFSCEMVHRSGQSEGMMRCARHMDECAPLFQLQTPCRVSLSWAFVKPCRGAWGLAFRGLSICHGPPRSPSILTFPRLVELSFAVISSTFLRSSILRTMSNSPTLVTLLRIIVAFAFFSLVWILAFVLSLSMILLLWLLLCLLLPTRWCFVTSFAAIVTNRLISLALHALAGFSGPSRNTSLCSSSCSRRGPASLATITGYVETPLHRMSSKCFLLRFYQFIREKKRKHWDGQVDRQVLAAPWSVCGMLGWTCCLCLPRSNRWPRTERFFPFSDNLTTSMFIVASDLSEAQGERLTSSLSLQGVDVPAHTFEAVKTVFMDLLCTRKSSMENPSLRVSGHGGSESSAFIVEGFIENEFGHWATDEVTTEQRYVDDGGSFFWTWDNTSMLGSPDHLS